MLKRVYSIINSNKEGLIIKSMERLEGGNYLYVIYQYFRILGERYGREMLSCENIRKEKNRL